MTQRKETVLIIGGTDGLGKAATLLLARSGYFVFAAGRSATKREELDRLAKVCGYTMIMYIKQEAQCKYPNGETASPYGCLRLS